MLIVQACARHPVKTPCTMSDTKLLLLEDYKPGRSPAPDFEDLRKQLTSLPGIDSVTLTPNGRSTVFATVPTFDQRDGERLKALVNEHLRGWRVIEEQSYGLPRTF